MARKALAAQWIEDHLSFDGDDCLYWPFGRSDGYGVVCIKQHSYWVHRYICERRHGPAPSPKHHAAHSCGRGNEGCVNPTHISWKTPSENQFDCQRHGVQHSSGKHGRITDQQVSEIRAMKGKKTPSEIAKMYGVARTYISAILDGRARTSRPRGAVRRGNRWGAKIKVNKKEIWLGYFGTEEEARAAYQAAANQVWTDRFGH